MVGNCIVFYESWQMECCGHDFKIGDTIKWLVYKCDHLNTPVDIGKVDYCYEAHDSNWKILFVLEGQVDSIKILYEKFVPLKNNPRILTPVKGILTESESARGFDKPLDDMEAQGYVVEVSNYAIRHARKKEVVFR